MFGSWSDLVGTVRPAPPADTADGSGSRVVTFTVHGTASHLSLTAYAYLPPGYDQAPLNTQLLPVVEVLDGFPGTPMSWLRRMNLQQRLDTEISAHRMPPAVVVLPYQTPDLRHDTECVNARGGVAAETFLTQDVPDVVAQRFRVRTDAASWGLVGYSAGGFCSVNLALRHPDRYAAAVSLSGYFQALTDHTTGDLYRGDLAAKDENSPLWRVEHLPIPPLAIYLAAARDDPAVYRQMRRFAAAAKPPLRLTTATTPLGGHTMAAWLPMIAPALDWLGSWLAGPEPAPTRSLADALTTPADRAESPR
jgi:enterochelin esterase-like enzyme